ncbi:MAG: hypothetical protein HYY37_01510 [Candidatus Aenigmarchaeota archaeon]|nr:hypothetical protein [Candidatus Aenigmarchaeota archaeon]
MALTASLLRELKLLKRHAAIVRILEKHPMGIVRLSQFTGLPPHRVRYSLRILQQNGLLEPSTKGAALNGKGRKFSAAFGKEKKKLMQEITSL